MSLLKFSKNITLNEQSYIGMKIYSDKYKYWEWKSLLIIYKRNIHSSELYIYR